LKESDNKDKLE